ncbi:MRN complex-interacting protein isoform X7 [Vulpes vulpes]|uniref:MRN complex-interacting protein isoform X7 n=1 Tax=Vulpes vulpes TaxID=9627 RepID=A0ABM4YCF5_VULVU
MSRAQRARVLRCFSCRLFQAHQEKKSLKWTCKACGEKQSFLQTYGEGSGADCRCHVQKLNLLQGQISEISLRKWSQSTVQPSHSPDVQNVSDSEVTLEPQKASSTLALDRGHCLASHCFHTPDSWSWNLAEELRTMLAWQGRSEKMAVTRKGAPGSLLFLRGVLHVQPQPHRSGPYLPSPNNFFCCLEMAPMWTQGSQEPCQKTLGQPGQHWLSRGPSGPRP